MQAVPVTTDLAVGRNRFAFGLLQNNHPFHTSTASLTFFSIKGTAATAVARGRAAFSAFGSGLKDTDKNSAAVAIGGVYVSYPTFRHAGRWGFEVRVRYKGMVRSIRSSFTVRAHTVAPDIGSPAPRSNNPTSPPVSVAKLDSGRPPDDMHRLSIAQAIGQHRPLVVLFATPAFCTSRMCGPETEVVEGLEEQFRSRVNFIHIEIYKDANPAKGYAPTVLQWHLQTEPWVFVINSNGIATARFEGPTPGSEIKGAIKQTLS